MKEEPDEQLQLPSPPQRRLSRSSIDLRDLEQQQHEKVTHTDSAPSIIVTDNFNFEIKKKSANSLQPLLLHKDFLIAAPIDSLKLATATEDDTDGVLNKNYNHELDILRDNDQLARFIEDNYFYYKKQSSATTSAAIVDDKQFLQQQNHHIGALSESDFVTFQTGDDEWRKEAQRRGRKNSKQKMLACSDSDFIVSYGSSTKKLSLKSRLQFARSLLTGTGRPRKTKLETPSPNNASASAVLPPVPAPPSNKGSIFFRKGKFGMLSKSCNGCYNNNKSPETPDIRSLQRVLSEGNNKCGAADSTEHGTDQIEHIRPATASPQQQTAVDIFLKLIDFEQGGGEKKSSVAEENLNNFNYDLAFNSKYETYCDQLLLLNLKTDNCNVASASAKMNSLCDFSVLQQNVVSPRTHKMSRSEQLVLINRCVDDKNMVAAANSVQSSCNNLYGGGDHVFVNSFVLNSPPPQAVQSSNDCSRNSHFSFSPTAPMEEGFAEELPSSAAMPTTSQAPPLLTTCLETNGLILHQQERIVPQILAESDATTTNNSNNGNISLILLNEHHSGGDGYVENGCQQTPIIKKDRTNATRHRHSSVVTYDINVINHHAADDLSNPGEAAGYSGGKRFSSYSTANNVARQSTSSASE